MTIERDKNGHFIKGRSANPGGRPKDSDRMVKLARKHTSTAIRTLKQIMDDVKAPYAARVAASTALLDRGWGRPTTLDVPVQTDGGGAPKMIRVEFVRAIDGRPAPSSSPANVVSLPSLPLRKPA